MQKQKVGVVFGGKSGEHEVSLKSAESIKNHLDQSKYEIVEIFVDKEGNFDLAKLQSVDVVFPIIHGTYGEDGSFQGLCEVLNLAYVGAGVLGSAIGMDKDVTKRLLSQTSGLNVGKWTTLRVGFDSNQLVNTVGELGWPLFVKPANLGSSVGVNKCSTQIELQSAISAAFIYDSKVLIEQYIEGREMECSVLGNTDLKVSIPGEIKVHTGFYDYKAKYQDEDNVELIIPAQLKPLDKTTLQKTALKVYETLECRGMARIDMFLKENGEVVVNEINTLPGFTNLSMYPKLWEASGLPYSKLLDELIALAIEDKKRKDQLKKSL
jgi:D-alanine-D-alanine ligase